VNCEAVTVTLTIEFNNILAVVCPKQRHVLQSLNNTDMKTAGAGTVQGWRQTVWEEEEEDLFAK